jgi:hypothetical protein
LGSLVFIPPIEILGLIASLAIASFAAWSNAGLQMRVRLLERDLDIVTDNLRVMQRQSARPQPRAAEPMAVLPVAAAQPRVYAPFAAPSLAEQLRPARETGGEDRVADERPDVHATAERLRAQSPETLHAMLRPALSLTGNLPDLLRGQEAKRLAEWLNNTPSGR